MTVRTRQVRWGEALIVEVAKIPGGLLHVSNAIKAAVGPVAGTRNTFAKLYDVGDPAELNERDLYRAWLLLAALGQQPGEWGVPDDIITHAAPDALRARLVEAVAVPDPLECRFRGSRVGTAA